MPGALTVTVGVGEQFDAVPRRIADVDAAADVPVCVGRALR